MEEKKIEPDWCLIKFDERRHWRDDIQSATKAIWSVYTFDRSSYTYCCELTPSYALFFVANEVDFADELEDDEEAREAVMTLVGYGESERVAYMHVSDVEQHIEAKPELFRAMTFSQGELAEITEDAEDENDATNKVVDNIAEGWGTGALMF